MEAEAIEGEPVHALELVPKDMQIARSPERVLEEAREAARALKDVLAQKKNKFMFRGEQYLQFEDWQTLGRFYGVTARVRHTQQVTYDESSGFEATAEAVRADGMVISAAEAMCMDDEANWRGKPIFQLRSMAQTRACAKALRNVLSWVAVLAGYAPTPAEEMTGQENSHEEPSMVCPDCGGQMWDNRATKKGRQPDYKCKDKKCNKAVWLEDTVTESNFESAERMAMFNAIKAAGKTLNGMGDTPEWTLSRANTFANENFNQSGGVDGLTLPQLGEMAQLLSARIDDLKKLSKGDLKEEKERQDLIKACRKADAALIAKMLNEHFDGKKLETLSLDELVELQDHLFPF